MLRYLKYYISTLTLILAIQICFIGEYYPTIFFICFSLFIILGDMILKQDSSEEKYSNEFLLNFPMYVNYPLLTLVLFLTISSFNSSSNNIFYLLSSQILNIDLYEFKLSMNLYDSVSLIALMGLFIGIMGTVPGHELVHRKNNKFDMFVGNWLLALSWDCAFAIEHVHGHHKNVGYSIDPATAKRGENIYKFIFRAISKEQKDAWQIEMKRLKRNQIPIISIQNRMLQGYMRSFFITLLAFFVGGMSGMMVFLLCAFIAKALLEVINFSEHYGLIRVVGEPVCPRHSWNSNSTMSSIYLYNVTRHSSHHEKANLKYWELRSYDSAPMMPQGYLTMLYMALFLPFFFHRMMAKKLLDWDENFANQKEKILAKQQNKNSGITLLADNQ